MTISIALIPIIAAKTSIQATMDSNDSDNNGIFASEIASCAVLGASLGNIVNGQAGNIFGYRKVATLYSIMVAISLLMLSMTQFFVQLMQLLIRPSLALMLLLY